ncbi:transcription initiation factor TFIID 23-30kDa subunit-domain-containing protein, partial [Piptocephalis cylindrospora]
AEDAERERQLAELLSLMDTYRPVIPETVTDYYLSEAGFQTSDPRIKRLLALAAQKFIADVVADAYRFARVRPQTAAARRNGKDKRTVLTNDDLASALSEYGVNVRKPDYYQ